MLLLQDKKELIYSCACAWRRIFDGVQQECSCAEPTSSQVAICHLRQKYWTNPSHAARTTVQMLESSHPLSSGRLKMADWVWTQRSAGWIRFRLSHLEYSPSNAEKIGKITKIYYFIAFRKLLSKFFVKVGKTGRHVRRGKLVIDSSETVQQTNVVLVQCCVRKGLSELFSIKSSLTLTQGFISGTWFLATNP